MVVIVLLVDWGDLQKRACRALPETSAALLMNLCLAETLYPAPDVLEAASQATCLLEICELAASDAASYHFHRFPKSLYPSSRNSPLALLARCGRGFLVEEVVRVRECGTFSIHDMIVEEVALHLIHPFQSILGLEA